MTQSTHWQRLYEERTAECVEAAAKVALEPKPRVWPISGLATEFNPGGHELSKPEPATNPLGVRTTVSEAEEK